MTKYTLLTLTYSGSSHMHIIMRLNETGGEMGKEVGEMSETGRKGGG